MSIDGNRHPLYAICGDGTDSLQTDPQAMRTGRGAEVNAWKTKKIYRLFI